MEDLLCDSSFGSMVTLDYVNPLTEQGWVMQGILSRASFRRAAVSGQKFFTVLSLHISNIHAKQKGIAKKLILTLRAIMISQQACEFNGTAWQCRSRNNLSTIDEAFTVCALPTPPGSPPLWGPGQIPDNWADVCGFLKPPGSDRFWKVRMHGAFSSHEEHSACDRLIKVATMRTGWTVAGSVSTRERESTSRATMQRWWHTGVFGNETKKNAGTVKCCWEYWEILGVYKTDVKRLEDNLNRRNEFANPETTVAVPSEGRTDATKRARQDELETPQESANTGGASNSSAGADVDMRMIHAGRRPVDPGGDEHMVCGLDVCDELDELDETVSQTRT